MKNKDRVEVWRGPNTVHSLEEFREIFRQLKAFHGNASVFFEVDGDELVISIRKPNWVTKVEDEEKVLRRKAKADAPKPAKRPPPIPEEAKEEVRATFPNG